MRPHSFAAFAPLPLIVALVAAPRSQPPPAPSPLQRVYDGEIRPALRKYCGPCHRDGAAQGGINVLGATEVAALQKDQALWRRIVRQIKDRTMPPAGSAQPTPAEHDRLVLWLSETLDAADPRLLPKDPGRVVLHRLNRFEYNNTVRDLFGVTTNPADKFPSDGGGGAGFDNNADTLYVPPVLLERYLAAADEVLAAADPRRLFFLQPGPKRSPEATARLVIARHASRAFRRPIAPEALERLMALYKKGKNHEDGVRLALKATLVSPQFLFRSDDDPGKPGAHPLDDWALASRLSYFLWSSMPDEALFALARQGTLRDPKVLAAQARRMLLDPKAEALAESFTGQWLRVRELRTTIAPDPGRFPEFTPDLREAMLRETTLFVGGILRGDSSLLELIDSRYTFLNGPLARHYGIEGVEGENLRAVALKDGRRGGLLTQGSILTLTSYPQRTSPVLRGKWILSELLGTPPPPPPPVVATLSTSDATEGGLTFRQRLEKHRTNPACASCHARIDPVGFALENFDAIGRWRETIGGAPVDAKGETPAGEVFVGPAALKSHLLSKKDDFVKNVAEKLLSYALGRGLEPSDLPTVRALTQSLAKSGYKSGALIDGIVTSYPFRYRQADPAPRVAQAVTGWPASTEQRAAARHSAP